MKKQIKIIIFILILMLFTTGCDFFTKEEEYKYKLSLYNINEIVSVGINTLAQNDNKVEIYDGSTIKVIYYMFENKQTNKKASDDPPMDVDVLYQVSFNTEKLTRTLFIYKKDDKYFIEETGEGLYTSSEKDFEKLESIINNNNFKYSLDNFKEDEITKVTISTLGQFDDLFEFTDSKNIGILHDIFSLKKSNIDSTDYNPDNPEVLYQVSFYDELNNKKSFYIYKRDNKYFIEVPFLGIFESNDSEFSIIENYTKKIEENNK